MNQVMNKMKNPGGLAADPGKQRKTSKARCCFL